MKSQISSAITRSMELSRNPKHGLTRLGRKARASGCATHTRGTPRKVSTRCLCAPAGSRIKGVRKKPRGDGCRG
jgi:hypothetical protein